MKPHAMADRIKQLAQKIAPDYPGIDSAPPFEQLYAIEQAHLGLTLALQDWQRVCDKLQEMAGATDEQVFTILRDQADENP